MIRIVLFLCAAFSFVSLSAQCELSFVDTSHVLCFGEATGGFELDVSSAVIPYDISCNGIMQSNNPIFSNLLADDYLVVIEDSQGCIDSIEIKIKQPSDLIVSLSCQGESLSQIIAIVEGGVKDYTYTWTDENNYVLGADSVIDYEEGFFYNLSIEDMNGCNEFDTIYVYAEFVTSTDLGGFPLDVTFTNLSSSGDYFWSFGELGNSSTYEPFYIFEEIGEHIIRLDVIDEHECMASYLDTINVQGFANQLEDWSNMSNVFSPNGDKMNDEFTFLENHAINDFKVSIYNRWGKKIYEWTDPSLGWRGENKSGNPASEGIYFYSMQSTGKDGTQYELKGSISLYR